jgi:hypothetical protein
MKKPVIKRTSNRRRKGPTSASRNAAIAATIARLDQLDVRKPKAERVIATFKSWLRDESGYDEETWPKLKAALESDRKRVGARGLFDG